MWEAKNQNRTQTQPMIETLESRQLLSAAPHAAVAVKAAPVTHAVVVSVKPVAKPKATPAPKVAAKPAPTTKAAPAVKTTVTPATPTGVGVFPSYIPYSQPYMAPDMVGTWTGTMQVDGSKTLSPFSVNFLFQRGLAASGTFDLGATVDNQTVTSTLVFGINRNARVLVLTSSIWMGFTCALSANGNVLYGRFAVNQSGGWETGSFTLNRN